MFSQQDPNSKLPSNWYQLSEVQRSGMLFQVLAQNQTTIQSLAQDYCEIRTELSDYSMRLFNREKSHACSSNNYSSEINQLKELRRRGANTAELKVTGIPADNTLAFSELANKLLTVLKLQDLCKDILEVRELKAQKAKITESASNVAALSENATDDALRGKNRKQFTAFVVKFKSHFVSQHVLKIKRQHGILNPLTPGTPYF